MLLQYLLNNIRTKIDNTIIRQHTEKLLIIATEPCYFYLDCIICHRDIIDLLNNHIDSVL